MVLLNGSPAYFEHVFTNQSGQMKESLHYTHNDHFVKKLSFKLSKRLFHPLKEFVTAEISQFR